MPFVWNGVTINDNYDAECFDVWNVLHRSLFGDDSNCKKDALRKSLLRAGAPANQIDDIIAKHVEQTKSTTVGSDLFNAGQTGLKTFIYGAGVIFALYLIIEFFPKKK